MYFIILYTLSSIKTVTRQKKLFLGSAQIISVIKMAYIQQPFLDQQASASKSSSPPPATPAVPPVDEPDMAKFYMSEYMIETMKMLYMMR